METTPGKEDCPFFTGQIRQNWQAKKFMNMDSLQIILVEDDPSAALHVEMLLSEMGYGLLHVINNGEQAVNVIVAEQPDLVIMDIGLQGKLSGLDVANEIQPFKIPLIFTTSFRDKETFDTAGKTYSFGYLVKPFDKLTLQSAIEQVIRAVYHQPGLDEKDQHWSEGLLVKDSFLIKHQNILYKVRLDDFLYIQGEGNYSTLFTKERKYVVKISLKKLLAELPAEKFSPVHKSYIVNVEKIEAIDVGLNKLIIGKESVPLGRNFKNSFFERFKTLK
jgi:DNA-binding LytR/AlgR family response regulator